jgi:hypothetical protein
LTNDAIIVELINFIVRYLQSADENPWSYKTGTREAEEAERPPAAAPAVTMRKDTSMLEAWAPPAAPQHHLEHYSSPMASTASLISSQIFTSGRVKVRSDLFGHTCCFFTMYYICASMTSPP